MKTVLYFFVFSGMVSPAFSAITIIPRPKSMIESGQNWILSPGDAITIVLGDSSGTIEGHGARILQNDIQKRFQITCTIKRESESWQGGALALLLGTRKSSKIVDQKCVSHSFPLSDTVPGKNGFVIRFFTDGGTKIALVGGSDANGVLYGQNSFFQMLIKGAGNIVLPLADITDYPSINTRGRYSYMPPEHFGSLNNWDAYMRARMNFVDLHGGYFGYVSAAAVDTAKASRVTREAHERGMAVWGVVQGKGDVADKMNAFGKLLNSGVDALWLSYDDIQADSNAPTLIRNLIQFAASAGLADSQVVIIPPDPDYYSVGSAWNRAMLDSVPASKNCQWVWTEDPSAGALATAKSMGYKYKPNLWWNWPRWYNNGLWNTFTIDDYWLVDLSDYGPVTQLSQAWYYRNVNYFESSAEVRNAGQTLSGAAFFGGDVQEEFHCMHFGLWAWNPEAYSYEEVRQQIYETVFGRENVPLITTFDSTLAILDWYFDREKSRPWPLNPYVDTTDQAKMRIMLNSLAQILDRLTVNPNTLLDSVRYFNRYIRLMRNELDTAFRYMPGMTPYKPGQWINDASVPKVKAAIAQDRPTRVHVVFSKLLDKTTAESAANYTITPPVTVQKATLGLDGRTVVLTTDSLKSSTAYTVTTGNVKDAWGNSITNNATAPFIFIPAVIRRLNFQVTATPWDTGWLADNGTPYSSITGHGWLSGSGSAWKDREGNNFLMRSAVTTDGLSKSYRVDVPDGEYIVRIVVGDNNYMSNDAVWQGSDTLIRHAGVSNGKSQDTLMVAGGNGLTLGVNGDLCYMVIMRSDAGLDFNLAAEDDLWRCPIVPVDPPLPMNTQVLANGPGSLQLGVAPNPFNPVSRISINLFDKVDLRLNVYNISGGLVKTLARGSFTAGKHSFIWDGTDKNNRGVSAGVYFYRLQAGGRVLFQKTVLAK